jgi:hypothetical protein
MCACVQERKTLTVRSICQFELSPVREGSKELKKSGSPIRLGSDRPVVRSLDFSAAPRTARGLEIGGGAPRLKRVGSAFWMGTMTSARGGGGSGIIQPDTEQNKTKQRTCMPAAGYPGNARGSWSLLGMWNPMWASPRPGSRSFAADTVPPANKVLESSLDEDVILATTNPLYVLPTNSTKSMTQQER